MSCTCSVLNIVHGQQVAGLKLLQVVRLHASALQPWLSKELYTMDAAIPKSVSGTPIAHAACEQQVQAEHH